MEHNALVTLKAWIAATVAVLTAFWGWFGWLMVVWAFLMLADWLVGMVLAHLPGVTLPFDYTVMIGPLVVVWYIIGELGSLVEHAVSMGAKRPAWLLKLLKAGKKAVDAAGDKLAGEDDETGGTDEEELKE